MEKQGYATIEIKNYQNGHRMEVRGKCDDLLYVTPLLPGRPGDNVQLARAMTERLLTRFQYINASLLPNQQ